jgi:hypothetical protein
VRRHPADKTCWFCTLADGQGGRSGGARAAQIACRAVMDKAATLLPSDLTQPSTWVGIVGLVDRAVAADPNAGYTTLVTLCVISGSLYGASSGDSSVLLVEGRDCRELTRAQVKNPPVGSGHAIATPFAARMTRPWMTLAMSDGVWKYVRWDDMKELTRTMRGVARGLLAKAGTLARKWAASGRFHVSALSEHSRFRQSTADLDFGERS